eukprot:7425731-Alexandrium_andersonii.AAC.1
MGKPVEERFDAGEVKGKFDEALETLQQESSLQPPKTEEGEGPGLDVIVEVRSGLAAFVADIP